MKIGIGIPNPVPGVDGRLLVDWAQHAEDKGFSTLATIDRIAYPSYESLVTLAAAAAVTERIGLFTNILLAPTRNPVLLAKEAASVDHLSGGRLTLGLAPGGRKDDFDAVEVPYESRGRWFDQMLELMHTVWSGQPVPGSPTPIGPSPVNGDRIPILFGGAVEATIRRIVEWGVGWTAGGGAAGQVGLFAERVREAWKAADREGEPRIVALSYFSLSEDRTEESIAYMKDYYAFLGEHADGFARSIPRTPEALLETAQALRDAGVDELIWDPTVADLKEIDLLADAVL